jgi:hypothetical protein
MDQRNSVFPESFSDLGDTALWATVVNRRGRPSGPGRSPRARVEVGGLAAEHAASHQAAEVFLEALRELRADLAWQFTQTAPSRYAGHTGWP